MENLQILLIMKKKFTTAILTLCILNVFGQSYKRLYDPSIVAQEKRQVFAGGWGDWRPYPKYFLGVQTNFNYATIWGMWAPQHNKDYKNGPDIRPLKPNGGEEVLRQLLTAEQESQTKKIDLRVDSLHARNMADYAYWTAYTVDADPLWLLYFKRKLKPVYAMADHPLTYWEWGLPNQEIYDQLVQFGTIERFQQELDVIKDKYYQCRHMDMPRGKRFLMYIDTYKRWRKFRNSISLYNQKTTFAIRIGDMLKKFKSKKMPASIKDDQQIAASVMEAYKDKF